MATILVTGGTQGVGRGMVEGLAEAGHTVLITGRDETRLEDAVAAAQALGGEGVPFKVDHADAAQIDRLFDSLEQTRPLDALVNNVWGGYEHMVEQTGGGERFTWADPFWQQPAWRWDATMTVGVKAAFLASRRAAPGMIARGSGLIVSVSYWAAQKHIANVLYGMAKAATDKMTADMAVELDGTGVSVLSFYPGLVRTEKVMANAAFLDLSNSESPRFSGRVLAALVADPELAADLTGSVCVGAELARRLGVTDVDGSSPEPLDVASA